ncbi:hypothetical protein [Bacillus marinisedimentorum]|uniref:hypothetical protein n=1 Tax=Bacillus marinisedimentorum TaxID=1821260 RepID=UPI000A9072CA|nr:hypothetical protein [Bacillus marinisedimentorum]
MNFFTNNRSINVLVLSILLIGFLLPPFTANGAEKDTNGFVIYADKIVGKTLVPELIQNGNNPGVRFKYESAVIYGMRMVKEVQSSNGPMTVHISADSPIHVTDMEVDASSFDFEGPCLSFGETYPEIGLTKVTLVASRMSTGTMSADGLKLTTEYGKEDIARPSPGKTLTSVPDKSSNIAEEQLNKILGGEAPFTCDSSTEDENGEEGTALLPGIEDKKLKDGIEEGAKKITEDAANVIDKTTETIDETKDRVLEQVPLDPEKTVRDLLEDPTGTAGKTAEQLLETTEETISDLKELLKEVEKAIALAEKIPGGEKTEELKKLYKMEKSLKEKIQELEDPDGINTMTVNEVEKELESVTESITSTSGTLDKVNEKLTLLQKEQANEEQTKPADSSEEKGAVEETVDDTLDTVDDVTGGLLN